MTGPEHYRRAEQLLEQAEQAAIEAASFRVYDDRTLEQRTQAYAASARLTARAQVHAQLALAAAAYDAHAENGGGADFGRPRCCPIPVATQDGDRWECANCGTPWPWQAVMTP